MKNPQIFRQKEMITVSRFARELGMSCRWVYNQIEKGKQSGGILAFRFGGTKGLRIPRTELERLKEERRIEPGA